MDFALNSSILWNNPYGLPEDPIRKQLVRHAIRLFNKDITKVFLTLSIIGAVIQPLPTAYLIFRAPSQAAGKCWMDALELSLRCSGLLLRSNSSPGNNQGTGTTEASTSHETQWSEADYEKHFDDQGKIFIVCYATFFCQQIINVFH